MDDLQDFDENEKKALLALTVLFGPLDAEDFSSSEDEARHMMNGLSNLQELLLQE